MHLQKNKLAQTPEWITELVEKLRDKLTPGVQIVCLEVDKNLPASSRDGECSITISDSKSAKTTFFETDGKTRDTDPLRWRDGSSKQRMISEFTYAIVENTVRGENNADPRIQRTCYVLDKHLYVKLREAVGLTGY